VIYVHIKATEVINNGNGTFTIAMPAKDVSHDDEKVLERLFPNLGDAVSRLLNQECLIQSVATQAELNAPVGDSPEIVRYKKNDPPEKGY
jgi:hypothetical protein